MALTLSGTNGVVGAGFTLDPSGVSVTAGVGTFTSLQGSAASLTQIPAANIVGVCTAGLGNASGAFGQGKILQVVSASTADTASFNGSAGFVDGGVSVTMTPSAASSKIFVTYLYHMGHSLANQRATRLARSVAGASYAAITGVGTRAYQGNSYTTYQIHNITLSYLDTPSYSLGQTVAYRVEVNPYTSTLWRNRYSSSDFSGHEMVSTITAMEIAA